MKIKNFKDETEIPAGIEIKIDNGIVTVSKDGKSLSKKMMHKGVAQNVENNKFVVTFKNGSKKEKMMANTFIAHIKNMFKGVSEGHKYKLKICSGHFPMNVAVSGNKLTISNFLGEKKPREMKIKEGVNLKIEGDIITIEGISKDVASQVAADIEQLTRIRGRDLRIYQDGIYITNKDGEVLS